MMGMGHCAKDGGRDKGSYDEVWGVTEAECRSRTLADPNFLAYEYEVLPTTGSGSPMRRCELHTSVITNTVGVTGSTSTARCLVKATPATRSAWRGRVDHNFVPNPTKDTYLVLRWECHKARQPLNGATMDFAGLDLTSCDFSGHTFPTDVRAIDVDFSLAILNDAAMVGMLADGASMRQVKAKGATLSFGEFKGADLTGADFTQARMDEVNADRATVVRAKFVQAHLFKAKFLHATLDGSSFSDANLNEADFEGASLVNVDFTGANLCGAKMDRTNLVGARFSGNNQCDHGSSPTFVMARGMERATGLRRVSG